MVTCVVAILLLKEAGRLQVLSLVMKILRKPKIEDIVCNIQNNEEDKEAFIVQYQPLLENQSHLSAADI